MAAGFPRAREGGAVNKAPAPRSHAPSPLVAVMAKQYDILCRLLMLGDSGVGKTCMLRRFTDSEFDPSHISTIGEFTEVAKHRRRLVNMCGKSVSMIGEVFSFAESNVWLVCWRSFRFAAATFPVTPVFYSLGRGASDECLFNRAHALVFGALRGIRRSRARAPSNLLLPAPIIGKY